MATHHIIVTGKVQGVFFRATAKKIAKSLELTGWVKNTADGDVEIVASGSEKKLSDFEEWCKIGPPQAEVENVSIRPGADEGCESFKILK